VNLSRLIAVFILLLAAASAHAQQQPAIQDAGNLHLTGVEDPATSKTFIVQLASPSAAEHHALIFRAPSVAASAPDDSGSFPRLEKDSAAIQAYTSRLEEEQQQVLSQAGGDTQQIYSYKYSLNGFAARMSIAQAQKLAGLPDVLNVWEDEVRPLATNHSAIFLDLFDIDNGLRSKQALDGEDVKSRQAEPLS
jgi:hypothetical protein